MMFCSKTAEDSVYWIGVAQQIGLFHIHWMCNYLNARAVKIVDKLFNKVSDTMKTEAITYYTSKEIHEIQNMVYQQSVEMGELRQLDSWNKNIWSPTIRNANVISMLTRKYGGIVFL